MTVNAVFWGFIGTAMLMVFHSEADHRLPALKNLSYTWVDPFTLNLSWSWDRPKHLPNCTIKYEIRYLDKSVKQPARTPNHHYKASFLTESNEGKFSIHAVAEFCAGWIESKPENIFISTQKSIVNVVKDFKCSIGSSQTNCSWEPVSPSAGLKISYRISGIGENNSLKMCNQSYSYGKRNGCVLENHGPENDIYVLAENAAGLQTFKARRVIFLPKLTIRENESYLYLEWTPPDIGKNCQLNYVVCYSECERDKGCPKYTSVLNTPEPLKIAYDKNCRYEFKFNATPDKYCPPIHCDGIAVEVYGNNTRVKLSDGRLTVVAIVIPLVLSVGVILSCYCFRRHRAILCPTMPDPSTIFKEMMNGNKEQKTKSESLYTPVPEPVEPVTITPVN
ncbi:uncharacterized protein LOC110950434 isoform X1 [Acanthochromis polyacanthus]|uniref:uncharacterized protein LOC110950434 isoform X1 n=1 Tax=Acanthochromis polyacanthus TaxID=80966 RepID=UPI002234653D|nr:uncharacterized protein LOC110950434 isoform X1 [Acanthochromis polyacanthus]